MHAIKYNIIINNIKRTMNECKKSIYVVRVGTIWSGITCVYFFYHATQHQATDGILNGSCCWKTTYLRGQSTNVVYMLLLLWYYPTLVSFLFYY